MQEPSRIVGHEHAGEVAVVCHGGDAAQWRRAGAEEDEACSDRESFFQCLESSGEVHVDGDGKETTFFPSDDEEEEGGDGDDVRLSFATAVGDLDEEEEDDDMPRYDYGMWMAAEPMSIQERRRRLLQGMGLASSRDLLRSRNARMTTTARLPPDIPRCAPRRPPAVPAAPTALVAATATPLETGKRRSASGLTRCRSDSRLGANKPRSFRRARSLHGSPVHKALHTAAAAHYPSSSPASRQGGEENGEGGDILRSFTISNLDDARELVASGWPTGTDAGAHLSMDEFERFLGYTTAKQFMRRSQSQPDPAGGGAGDGDGKPEKKRHRWLKNIKLVASAAGFIHEKDKDRDPDGSTGGRTGTSVAAAAMSKSASVSAAAAAALASSSTSPERLKVHHYGKASKELTALYMRQEVHAHEGAIWTIKFSPDGRLLASGGEDRVVRVWRVVDADADASSSGEAQELSTPPLAGVPNDGGAPGLAAQLSRKVRRGRSAKHGALPEHVVVPETVFALAADPACVLDGHTDDVLDLSWSKSQLLSSSMDKTVRLWDTATSTCLKVFAHSDYVTCVQFNPADAGHFISGSLDCKVRIWSVAERQVVDWSDLSDMVTAACYTPDGQAAIIGSHKGSCRFYKTTDCKLNQEAQIDMSLSKKPRSQAKKITGFQFAPGNPSEILVTSADSQIRVFNGITVLQKFKGFKNTSSQISACYTPDGRYVVCASEDSHVYVWRRAGGPGSGVGAGVRAKAWLTSRSYEHFFCRDVSAAVPWPGSPPFLRPASADPDDHRAPTSVSAHGGGRRPKSGPMTCPGGMSGRHGGGAEGGNAWGLVVVAASRGGEIRVYQNFGLPLKIRGQGNLFH